MISARWFFGLLAVVVFGLSLGALMAPVAVPSDPPMYCSEALDRYYGFVGGGVEPEDGVVPSHEWAAACEDAITGRKVWAWPALVVSGVTVLGAVVIRRRPSPGPVIQLNP